MYSIGRNTVEIYLISSVSSLFSSLQKRPLSVLIELIHLDTEHWGDWSLQFFAFVAAPGSWTSHLPWRVWIAEAETAWKKKAESRKHAASHSLLASLGEPGLTVLNLSQLTAVRDAWMLCFKSTLGTSSPLQHRLHSLAVKFLDETTDCLNLKIWNKSQFSQTPPG